VNDPNQLPLDELFRTLPIGDSLTRLLAIAAEEDLGQGGRPGDITTQCCIPPSRWADGIIVAREPGILSGIHALPNAMMIFSQNCQLLFHAQDGETLRKGQRIAVLTGPMYQVLRAERTMLNLLGRMSGIATRTAEFVKAIEGTGAKLLDTRKTTPGWRALEKYAVRCGGGHCHRTGLHDAVLFKDNHIFGVPPRDLPQWVTRAVEKARRTADIQGDEIKFVELEVDSLDQLEPVLAAGGCGVDIILLDNMDCETMRRALEMRTKHKSDVQFEASGGVTLQTIRAIAETGVELISVGGLTHHAVSLDVSMDIQDAEKPQGWGEEADDEPEPE
jgi:nicotinate-nucleotide pyrophosphorylase (carboxylating)